MLRTGAYGVENRGWVKWLTALPGLGALRAALAARIAGRPASACGGWWNRSTAWTSGRCSRTCCAGSRPGTASCSSAPEMYLRDLARAAEALDRPVPGPRADRAPPRAQQQSWLHNSQRLVKGKPRCTLLIHPDDAARRGVQDGATVLLRSRVGRCRCRRR